MWHRTSRNYCSWSYVLPRVFDKLAFAITVVVLYWGIGGRPLPSARARAAAWVLRAHGFEWARTRLALLVWSVRESSCCCGEGPRKVARLCGDQNAQQKTMEAPPTAQPNPAGDVPKPRPKHAIAGNDFAIGNVPNVAALLYLCMSNPAWSAVNFGSHVLNDRTLYIRWAGVWGMAKAIQSRGSGTYLAAVLSHVCCTALNPHNE
jgi:hypothetical protein